VRQWPSVFQGNNNGTEYRFASADFLNWEVSVIGHFDQQGLHIAPPERMAITSWAWYRPEDKWVSAIWTAFTDEALDAVEVEGDEKALFPPPCSEDWDSNSLAYNHYLDFDPAFVPVGHPERIRDDGSIHKKSKPTSGGSSGPFGGMSLSGSTNLTRRTDGRGWRSYSRERLPRSLRDQSSEAPPSFLEGEPAKPSTSDADVDASSEQERSSGYGMNEAETHHFSKAAERGGDDIGRA
jgi:hypothetical protein